MNKQTPNEILNIVKKNYDEIAELYDKSRQKPLMPLWKELVDYAKKIKDGGKVLDVGCGNGRLNEAFRGKRVDYTGIDQCEKLLGLARKINPGKRFIYENAQDLRKIPDVNFDYLFCIATLHHLPGLNLQIQALKQFKNKINADGEIFIANWNLWTQPKQRRMIIKFFLLKLVGKNKMDFGDILFDWKNSRGENVSQRYYHAFTKRELKKIARAAGLKIVKLYKDKFNYYLILKK